MRAVSLYFYITVLQELKYNGTQEEREHCALCDCVFCDMSTVSWNSSNNGCLIFGFISETETGREIDGKNSRSK